MSTVVMSKKDELIMKLVHYFVTEQNYNPIIVNGAKDEIWLENIDGPYRVIRINSNSIINNEQLEYDELKIKSIVSQIKKKTFSFHVDTLNIFLNVDEDLKVESLDKNITSAIIKNNNPSIEDANILEAFPDINEKLLNDKKGVDLIINVTNDLNQKNEKEGKIFEKVFSPKKTFFTPLLICVCILMYIMSIVMDGSISLEGISIDTLVDLGANNIQLLQDHEIWRLCTYMFLHGSVLHLLFNMYALYILGTQVETFIGKIKFVLIYAISGLMGGLFSAAFGPANVVSVGASGAIFGLLGALLYFGYTYRSYLGNNLLGQIVPIIILNLFIGFMPNSGIDNFCHIGGIVGGLLTTMMLGVAGRNKKSEKINATIVLLVLIGFFTYFIFFK